MTTRIAIFGLLLSLLCGCARNGRMESQTGTAELHPVQSVCAVLKPDAHFSDPHITVRGQLGVLSHSAVLTDSTCDDKRLLVEYVAGGPHFLFCESERLSEEFGCPGGRNGPIVTVRGVLSSRSPSADPSMWIFAIEEIVAYESTRTGKSVTP
jgi:hypothetical protein